MQLLQARTTNGSGTAVDNTAYLQTVFCSGTFGGATVTLEASPDNSDWFSIVSFTTKSVKGVGINARFLRGSVSGATGTTSVNLILA